jgi:hypothetical protein
MERGDGIIEWERAIDLLLNEYYVAFEQDVNLQLIFFPVHAVNEARLDSTRENVKNDLIDYFNVVLERSLNAFKSQNEHVSTSIRFPTIASDLTRDAMEETEDGLHFNPNIYRVETDILLNSICNHKLFAETKAPTTATCCVQYQPPNWKQIFVLALLFILGPIMWLLHQGRFSRSVISY